MYRATPTSEGLTFNYFSGEVDKSIQDVIDDIAGRAGPVLSKGKTLLNQNFTAGNVIGPVHRKNIIVKLFMTTASTVNLYFRGSSVQTGFHLQIGRDTLKYYDWMGTLQENVTQYLDINGQQFYCYREYRHLKYMVVSLQDNFLTVWGNGKMLWSRELCLDDQLFDAGDAFSMQVAAGHRHHLHTRSRPARRELHRGRGQVGLPVDLRADRQPAHHGPRAVRRLAGDLPIAGGSRHRGKPRTCWRRQLATARATSSRPVC